MSRVSASTLGPSPRRLALDNTERSISRLRFVSAVVVGLMALWIVALRPEGLVWVVVVACLAAVLGWGLSVVRTRRRSHLASRYYLDLSAEGLALAEGEARHQIAWAEVEGIWVDEERIQVVIERKGEEPLRIEPRYGGLGAYGLAEYLGSTLQNVLDS